MWGNAVLGDLELEGGATVIGCRERGQLQLAAAAGPIKASRDRLDRLLSLPIRPGP